MSILVHEGCYEVNVNNSIQAEHYLLNLFMQVIVASL